MQTVGLIQKCPEALLVPLLLVLAAGCASTPKTDISPETIAQAAQHAHGLEAWWGKEVVQADVSVVFGDESLVDARFWFEANGPRVHMKQADERGIVFDGQDAYLVEGSDPTPRDRFNVLTWPFFIYAPLKITGEGSRLSDSRTIKLKDTLYVTVFQTFEEGEGDTPKDWYRYFIHPETHRVEWASYIVTFGKTFAEANQKPSIIHYQDFQSVDGVILPMRYEFWYWDREAQALKGASPKGTGVIRNLTFLPNDQAEFLVPEGAVQIPLPSL